MWSENYELVMEELNNFDFACHAWRDDKNILRSSSLEQLLIYILITFFAFLLMRIIEGQLDKLFFSPMNLVKQASAEVPILL